MKLFSWFKRNPQENVPLEPVSVNKSYGAAVVKMDSVSTDISKPSESTLGGISEEPERRKPIYDENEPVFTPVGRDGRWTWIRTLSRSENERREKLYNQRKKSMNKNESIQEKEISDSEEMVLRPEVAETVSINSSYSSYDDRHSPGSSFNFNIFS